ncbi:hypothetical protein CDAR_262961 [Caerostris darwini]|uniref:Secreted protein n=1 Tax=Caerostris darwini TaxID=1538125 RepID=A0AAV4RZK8_9ARAC|nr:hypothetical protein CDAR_262961 [Caerostris darwini]
MNRVKACLLVSPLIFGGFSSPIAHQISAAHCFLVCNFAALPSVTVAERPHPSLNSSDLGSSNDMKPPGRRDSISKHLLTPITGIAGQVKFIKRIGFYFRVSLIGFPSLHAPRFPHSYKYQSLPPHSNSMSRRRPFFSNRLLVASLLCYKYMGRSTH